MGFLPSPKHHDLVEADRLRVFHSKDADTVKLAGQQACACAHSGSWNNEHQHALAGHPAITVFQEHQLHSLITVRSKLIVIGRVKIQERTGFSRHSALKGTAVNSGNAITVGGFGAVGIEFDSG